MKATLKIAVCQMTSVDDVDFNLRQIEDLLSRVSHPIDIAFFPENCVFMRLKEGEKIDGLELSSSVFEKLKALAQNKKTALHLGSVPLKEGSKLTNSTIVVWPDGRVQGTYRKMHLFDIALEGQKPIRESDVFHHGPAPAILDFETWKFGQTICYDIRFAELFSFYARHAVDVITVPAAFLVKTGQAHWEILLRARAIESQCYIVAAAQAGNHINSRGDQRSTYGHSLVISPWGDILAQASQDKPEVLVVELDRARIDAVRKQIPMRSHRRL